MQPEEPAPRARKKTRIYIYLYVYRPLHITSYISETKAKLVLCEPSCGLLGSPA